MDERIKINDFAKLTKTTVKTVLYYHKIGLIKEPERSAKGYRLYGGEELTRMRLILHMKSIGMDLRRIKATIGDTKNEKSLRNILISFREELRAEQKNIEARISRIDELLLKKHLELEKDTASTALFEKIADLVGEKQMEGYAGFCPEIYEQQKDLFGIYDDFQWGEGLADHFKDIGEYFKHNPEQFQRALGFGNRLAKLDKLDENDPEVESLAMEVASFIISVPELKEKLYEKKSLPKPLDCLLKGMIKEVLSPARMKHKELLEKHLSLK